MSGRPACQLGRTLRREKRRLLHDSLNKGIRVKILLLKPFRRVKVDISSHRQGGGRKEGGTMTISNLTPLRELYQLSSRDEAAERRKEREREALNSNIFVCPRNVVELGNSRTLSSKRRRKREERKMSVIAAETNASDLCREKNTERISREGDRHVLITRQAERGKKKKKKTRDASRLLTADAAAIRRRQGGSHA